MPTTDATKTLYKLVALLTSSQRMQDRITAALALPSLDATAATKLTESNAALETQQVKLTDAIAAQVAAH